MRKTGYYGFLIFLFCILIGFIYARLWYGLNNKIAIKEEELKNNINTTNIIETFGAQEKISPNANFALKKYYTECGHSDFQYAELPIELVNQTEEQIKKIYEDWDIEEFNSDLVILYTKVEGLCDEHYFIKLGDEYIEIYNLNRDGSHKLYKQTDITREYLTKEDIKSLEEGVNVAGREKVNSIIEDFE